MSFGIKAKVTMKILKSESIFDPVTVHTRFLAPGNDSETAGDASVSRYCDKVSEQDIWKTTEQYHEHRHHQQHRLTKN